MLIKVCGMREPENIREVAGLGVNWIGLIFYPKSPRCVNAPVGVAGVRKVGVFVDVSVEYMMEKAMEFGLDYLQLHGNESADDCHALRKRGYAVIKAFSVASAEDLEKTAEYEGRADYFLFDTKCGNYGGSGQQFDWGILAAYRGETPFLLSGGIGPDSVEAVRSFHHPRLAGIDLNSRFEMEPGLKDVGKLRVFIEDLKK